jgi:hypothetical protein
MPPQPTASTANPTPPDDKQLEQLQKDIYNILEKHGIKKWQMSYYDPISKTPIILARGEAYTTCRLAIQAVRILKAQVDKELSIKQE